MKPRQIRIEDYNYLLPDDKIAKFPAEKRDDSRLLVYQKGKISETIFAHLGELLHAEDLLVMNDTRVIPARLLFNKPTGGQIEIFCLEPLNSAHQDAMSAREKADWKCLIGGAKKWKSNDLLAIDCGDDIILKAEKIEKHTEHFVVRFSWSPADLTFSEVIARAGLVPLPPYFNRSFSEEDRIRYQTVFAKSEGSVAAPTAALHFTSSLLNELVEKGIDIRFVTLHVGAGTFKPVTTETIGEHNMHSEAFSVSTDLIKSILSADQRRIIAVGTTSMRTLESLYWLGVKLMKKESDDDCSMPILGQWEAYEEDQSVSISEALNAILNYCAVRKLNFFSAQTAIMISPGYCFRICRGLITNFHMPKSTLMVLVSAFVGEDWKKIYHYAMEKDFRFLSYGDSSFLLP